MTLSNRFLVFHSPSSVCAVKRKLNCGDHRLVVTTTFPVALSAHLDVRGF